MRKLLLTHEKIPPVHMMSRHFVPGIGTVTRFVGNSGFLTAGAVEDRRTPGLREAHHDSLPRAGGSPWPE